MTLTESWRELHRSRFPDLPLDCGNSRDPGVVYGPDLRDWSDKATTTDQAMMERYVDRYDLRNARLLHIGIGNSGLARRFHGHVAEIVGTTIDEPEMAVARGLRFPNYTFVLHNKYSDADDAVEGVFDFILDNNPTSPCCCFSHLARLFEFYAAKLDADGQIVTDRHGLEWVPPGANPRWVFSFEDLAAVGAVVGLSAFRMTRSVYVLARSAPQKPSIRSRSKSLFRRTMRLAGKVFTKGPRALALKLRNVAGSR